VPFQSLKLSAPMYISPLMNMYWCYNLKKV
jgi:hypothetical protein